MAEQGGTLHEDMREVSALAGYGLRRAGVIGALTTAQVTAAANAEALVTDLDSVPGTVHAEHEYSILNAQRALQAGDAIGDFSDSRVAAATTVESLVQDTEAATESDSGHLGPGIIG